MVPQSFRQLVSKVATTNKKARKAPKLTVESLEGRDVPAGFYQGFEDPSEVQLSPSTTPGWNYSTNSAFQGTDRVASGTNGVSSLFGSWHAVDAIGSPQAVTNWGGFNSVFPAGGYRTLTYFYLDVNGGFTNDTRFAYTSAINNTAGLHRRDFVFSGGFYDSSDMSGPGAGTNRFVFSASNNSPGFPKDVNRSPVAISATGWYGLEHRFYDSGSGVLAVDLTLRAPNGSALNTWTLSDPTDVIGSTVGGNRYGWISFNQFPQLTFDETAIFPGGQASNVFVNPSWAGIPYGADPDGAGPATAIGYDATNSIQNGIDLAATGGQVNLAAGTYDQTAIINKPLVLQGAPSHGSVIAPTTGAQQVVLSVTSPNVTINGVHVQVNQNDDPLISGPAPIAPVGIGAVQPLDFSGLTISNTKITSIGDNTFANWTGSPGLSVRAAGIVLYDSPSGGIPSVTLLNNNIDVRSGTSFYQRAVWLAQLNAAITGNTFRGAANDLIFQFPSGGASTISGNTFSGWQFTGGGGVVIGDPNAGAPVTLSMNSFLPDNAHGISTTSLQVNRNAVAGSPITISNNTFDGHTIGIDIGGAQDVAVTANSMTPKPGVTFTHVRVNSQSGSNNGATSTTINTTINGNTFSNAAGATGTAIVVSDTLAGSNFTGVSVGTTLDNSYAVANGVSVAGGLVTVQDTISNATNAVAVSGGKVVVAGSTLSNNTFGISVNGAGTLELGAGNSITGGNTGIAFNGGGVALTGNSLNNVVLGGQGGSYVAVNGGALAGIEVDGTAATFGGIVGNAATTAQGFAIEDRIAHAVDTTGVGFVRVKSNEVFTTPTSGSVQRGIDASIDGNIVNAQTGSFTSGADATASGKGIALAAGASPGQVTLSGSLIFDSNDTLPIEINGTNPATQFDNFIVNGATVDLGSATLSITGSHSVADGDSFLIITKGSTGAITGTFAGLAEGAVVSTDFLGSGKTARITYLGGDGNDVAIVVDGAWIYNSTGGDRRLVLNGSNLEVRDGGGALLEARPYAGVTALSFNGSNTLADSLTVDYSGGNPLKSGTFVTFNGGMDTSNDRLLLTGGSVTTVKQTFVNNSDGSVDIDGRVVAYVGLEPIVDNLNAVNREFIFTGGSETITVSASPLVGFDLRIDSTLGELVDFTYPSSSVTITASTGDVLTINSTVALGAGKTFTANVPTINLNADITASTIIGNASTVNVAAPGQIQDAVNLSASGATVNVAAGTYADPVNLTLPITVLGPNSGISPNGGVRVGEAIISGAFTIANGALGGFVVKGLELFGSIKPLDTNNNVNVGTTTVTFEKNRVINSGQLALITGIPGAAINATITDNLFSNSSGNAMQINGGPGSVTVDIQSNTINTTVFGGINTDSLAGATISNNTILNTAQQAINIASANTGLITISNNVITNANTSNATNRGAIRFAGSTVSGVVNVLNNTITGSNNGIYSAPATNTATITISGNSFVGTTSSYLAFAGSGFYDATAGNTYDGVASNSATLSQLYAIEDKVFHRVDSATVTGFARVRPGNVYVTPSSGSIQRGVDAAAAGDTVNVAAGTYIENVVVDRAVSLRGSNFGINPNTGVRVAESVLVPATNNVASGNVITITANGVTIDGLTIDGNNATLGGGELLNGVDSNANTGVFAGVGIDGLTVSNNIIKNLVGNGVRGTSNSAGSINNTIQNNLIDNMPLNGPTYFGRGVLVQDNYYATIANNVITRARAGIQTNNYWQPNTGAAAAIIGNSIGYYVRGIFHNLHYQAASAFSIANNTITAEAGAPAGNGGLQISSILDTVPVSISGNTVSGADTGIEVWNAPTTTGITINGGSVSGSTTNGVLVTNRNGFGDAAGTGNVTLNGLTITNSATGVRVFDDPANANGSIVRLLLAGVNAINVGNNSLFVSGSDAQLIGNTLGTTAFGGPLSQYVVLANGALNGVEINGQSATFDGLTGASATLAQNFAIEDRITHATDTAGIGFVRVKASNVYVTPASGSIQRGVNAASAGDTVNVAAGTFNEDVTLAGKPNLQLLGAGAGSTTIVGQLGGANETLLVDQGQLVDGFTITRVLGGSENNVGVTITTGATGWTLRNNVITGNRSAIYLNGGNSAGTITRNIIDDNRTGIIAPDTTGYGAYQITENAITNNRTFGILLDAPTAIAAGFTISNNNIGGNFAVQFENNTGSTVNASNNWWGTANPVLTLAKINGTLPGSFAYPGPVTPPGAPYPYQVTGSSAALIDYSPFLVSPVDIAPATAGFQGDYSTLAVHTNAAQTGSSGRITEGYASLTSTGTIQVRSGTYTENVDLGAGANKSVALAAGTSPGQVVINGNLTLTGNDSLPIEINGTNAITPDYDNFVVNGAVTLGNATLPALTGSYVPVAGDVFTIISNDASDPVSGIFAGLPAGSIVTLNGQNLRVFYTGNDGNDVVLASQTPTVAYVEDTAWAGLALGDFIADADFGTATAPAIFGYNAFSTIADAQAAVGASGTVIVNSGTYPVSVTLSGTQTLRVTDGASVTMSSLTTAAGQTVNLLAGSTLTVNGAAASSLAGSVSGAGALVKSGAGNMTINGANSHAGGTTINAGTLTINNNNALGTGTFTINGGTIQSTSGSRLLNNAVSITNSFTAGGTDSITLANGGGTINLGGATRTVTVTNSSMTVFFEGVVSSGGIIKDGAGRLALQQANTYTEGTSITAGVLSFDNNNAAGTGPINTSGGTLRATGATRTLPNNVSVLNNFAIDGTQTLRLNGVIDLIASTRTVTVTATSPAIFGGDLSNGGLVKSGTGTLILANNNSYAGTTTINAGVLQVGEGLAAGTLGTATSTIVNDGILRFNRSASLTLSRVISGTGNLEQVGPSTLTLNADNTYLGTTLIASGSEITVSNGGTSGTLGVGTVTDNGQLTFNRTDSLVVPNLIQGTGLVRKNNVGTITLSNAANTYTGATILNGGVLIAPTLANGGLPSSIGASTNVATNLQFAGGTLRYTGPSVSVDRLFQLATAGGTIDSAGSSELTLSNTGAISLSGSGARTLTITGAANTTLTPTLGDSGGASAVVKSGAGTLTLPSANGYTGTTTINSGTVVATNSSSLGSVVGGTTIVAGSTLDVRANIGTEAISVGGLGVGSNGALITGVGSGTVGGPVTLTATTALGGNGTLAINGIIGGGFDVSKVGSGTTTLGGANTYGGATLINAGTLRLGAANVIPNTSDVFVAGGTTLDLNGFSEAIDGLTGTGLVTSGAVGAITLTVGSNNEASPNFGGVIQNGSGTVAFTKVGNGNQTLSGANTFTGTASVDGGTLTLAGGSAIADVTAVVVNLGTLALSASETIGSLHGGGAANVSLGANTLSTGGNNSSTTFAGIIAGVGGGLTKQGSGQFVLSNTNTYTGSTTVQAGNLSVLGSIATSSLTTVQSGATLSGFGTVGATTINSGATHAPGTSPGIMNVVGTYTENGILQIEILNHISAAGVGYDQVNVTGSVSLGGTSTLTTPFLGLGGTFNPALGQVFTIIANDGNDPVTGTFSGLPAGTVITVDGKSLKIYYDGNFNGTAGNDVVLVSASGTPAVLYVNDQFTTPTMVDGDAEQIGFQTAYVGVDAFASIADALAMYPGYTGDILVNGGSYATANLAGGGNVTLKLVRDLLNSEANIAISAVTGDATDTIATRFYAVSDGNLTIESGSFAGTISGGGSLTKANVGTLSLSGNNTYTGTTTISAGSLVAQSANALGTIAGNTTVASGAVLALSPTVATTFAESLVLNGSGISNGGALVNQAQDNVVSGGITLGSIASIGVASGTTLSTSTTGITDGASSFGLTKTGTGTLTLGTANTFDGGTTISQGTVLATVAGAFGTAGITLGDANTAANPTAVLLANSVDITNPVTVSAAGTGTATIGSSGAGVGGNATTFAGTITLNRPTTISSTVSDRLAIDGQVTGPVGTLTVTGGQRTTLLSTANNFAGNIQITGSGTVLQSSVASAGEVIPNASNVDVGSGTTFQLAGSSGTTETINALTGTGGTITRAVAGTQTLVVGSANGGGTFSGAINNGSGTVAFTKVGTGTQAISGTGATNNTANGLLTVSAGQLDVGPGFTGDGAWQGNVTIASGATLRQTQANVFNNSSDFTINGTFNMNGTSDVIGNIAGSGAITNNGGLSLDDLAVNAVYSGSIAGGGSLNLRAGVTAGSQTLSGTVNVSNLGVSQTANRTATLNVTGGTTTISGELLIGDANSATGIMNQSGGTIQVNNRVRLGHWPNNVSQLNLSAGTLGVTNALNVGWDGIGQYTQSGGTLNAGSVRVDGSGITNPLSGQEDTFAVSGGTANMGTLAIDGGITNVSGTGVVNSASLSVVDSNSGIGTVNQSGGTVNVSSLARIGHFGSNTGTYNLSAGALNLTGTPGGVVNPAGVGEQPGILYLGVDGTGVFTQTGGTVTAPGVVLDARGNTAGVDTLTLNGGTMTLGTSGIKSGSLDANTSYQINQGGGTLSATANWSSALNMSLTNATGPAIINTNGSNIGLSGSLTGVGGFQKNTGAGTLTLSGTNSYGGTTNVNAGTLLVNGSNSGSGAVNVNNTAVLGGTGSIAGSVNANNSSTIAAGVSPETLATGPLSMIAGTTLAAEIGGTAPGNGATGYDQLIVTGAVNLGNATLNLSQFGGFVVDPNVLQAFTIVDNDGSVDPVTGIFAGLPEGSSITFAGGTVYVSYAGGDGNDVVLYSQPVINGTPGDDTLVLRQVSGNPALVEFSLNGAPFVQISSGPAFNFNGAGGIDQMVVDTSNGDPISTNNANYINGEYLRIEKVTGGATDTATYSPSALAGQGTVTIAGYGDIAFAGSTNVDFVNMTAVNVNTAAGDDSLSLADGSTVSNAGTLPGGYATTPGAALVVTGANAVVGLRNIGTTTVTTNGDDAVTVNTATGAHGISNLSIATGTGADTVNFAGPLTIGGDLSVASQNIVVNATATTGATGTATLTATGGSITTGGVGVDIVAQSLVATASGGIDLDTTVTNITAIDTSVTGISIDETNGANLLSVLAVAGPATVTSATGDLNVTSVGAAVSSTVTLTATTGAITDANGGSNNVAGNALVATAATGINIDTGTSFVTATTTGVGSILIDSLANVTLSSVTSANGPIVITSTGSINAASVTSTADVDANDISLTAATNIVIGTITAGAGVAADVNLTATGGNITDDVADTMTDVTAQVLTVSAGTDVGSLASTIDTAVGTLTGSATTGDIYVDELNGLTIGGTGLTAGDAIVVTTGSTIIVTQPLVAGSTATLDSGNGVSVTSSGSVTGGTGVTTTSAGTTSFLGAVVATTGPVSVTSNNGMVVNATGSIAANGGTVTTSSVNSSTFSGTVNATGAINASSSTGSVTVNNIFASSSSSVTIAADDNVTINGATSAATTVGLTATTGTVSNTAAGTITGGTGVTTSSASTTTLSGAVVATTGPVSVTSGTDLTVNATGSIAANGGTVTTLSFTGSTFGGTVNATGAINASSSTGSVTVNNTFASSSSSVTITADDNVTINGATSAGTAVSLTATTGAISSTAAGPISGGSVTTNSATTTTFGGTVTSTSTADFTAVTSVTNNAAMTIAGAATVNAPIVNVNGVVNAGSYIGNVTTANLNANITATISGTATTVNVDDAPSGEVQDGIDIAANTDAIVNVTSGTYSNNADATAPGKSITLAIGGAGTAEVTLNGNLVLNAGDVLDLDLTGATSNTSDDKLLVNGTVNLGGATLAASIAPAATVGQTFTLIQNDLADTVTGTFAGIVQGQFVTIGGQLFQLSYVGGTAGSFNDVTVTAINPTGPIIQGTPGADHFKVVRNGLNLDIYLNGNLIWSPLYDSILTGITFDGLEFVGPNTLEIDVSGGDPIPDGGLKWSHATSSFDQLILTGTNEVISPASDGNDTFNLQVAGVPVGSSVNASYTGPTGTFALGLFKPESIHVNGLTPTAPGGLDTVNFVGTAGNDSFQVPSSGFPGSIGMIPLTTTEIERYGFDGLGGNDTLYGANVNTQWDITGTTSIFVGVGFVNGSPFAGIENLIGGTANDTFNFANGRAVLGFIDGGAGFDLFDYNGFTAFGTGTPYIGYTTGVVVNMNPLLYLVTGTGSNVLGGAKNFESVIGGLGSDLLVGDNFVNTFSITGANAGTLTSTSPNHGPIQFTGFESLQGGIINDTFVISAPGTWTGAINGTNGNDTLVGPNIANTWNVNGTNFGTLNSITQFSAVENLIGNDQADTFTFANNAQVSGSIVGGAGADSLSYAAFTATQVNVNLAAGTATQTGGISGIETFTAGQSTQDRFEGPAANNTWNLTSSSSGTVSDGVNTYTFTGFELPMGGSGDDTFNLANGANFATITGGAGNDTLVGPDLALTYQITSAGGGTLLNGVSTVARFATLENFTGGNQADTFAITTTSGGSVPGVINGGGGSDRLTYSSSSAISVNLSTGAATAINGGLPGGIASIESLAGGSGNDTLTGGSGNNVWTVTAANTGDVNGFGFSGIENLTGGAANDDFTLAATATVTGKITGSAGANSLTYGYTTPVTVNLQSLTATGTGGIADIGSVTGGSGSDTLIGQNIANTWTINALNGGAVNSTSFAGFENLTGGTTDDQFVMGPNVGVSGRITGGTGVDSIDYSAFTTDVNVNLATGAASGTGALPAGGVLTIESFTGGSGNNTLTAPNAINTWNLTTTNGGTVTASTTTYTFAAFGNLVGGISSDTFNLSAGANFTSINGGTGTDRLVAPVTGNHTFNITGASAGNLNGTLPFTSIESATGGNGDDTFVFGAGGSMAGQLNGLGGSNTLDYQAYMTPVTINMNGGTATGTGGAANFQNAYGGASNDNITGNGFDNIIFGGGGNDIIFGGSGNDVLVGGDGNDSISGDAGLDVLIGGDGKDTVNGGSGDDVLISMSVANVDSPINVANAIALRNAWTAGVYAARVAAVQVLLAGQANNDGEIDTAIGGTEQDAFFLNPTDLTPDRVIASETRVTLP